MRQLELIDEVGKANIWIEAFPDSCPICLQGIDPRLRFGYFNSGKFRAEVVFQCPRIECHQLFIAYYYSWGDVYHFTQLEPQTYNPREFSEFIISISSDFARIFNQAQHAEQLGMLEIAGPGYRKSLEFLIKDYSILRNPEASETIKSKQLSNVINDYVADINIKSTSKRAAWLGNDETHYYRKWGDKDIRDLKILIELTVRWIESEELTRKYEADMTD